MMYATIISLLIETTLKPFYLLRPQSFNSFQIVYRYICEIFWLYVPRVGAFDSLFCPEGRVFVQNDCPEGKGFCSFQVMSQEFVPGGDGFG